MEEETFKEKEMGTAYKGYTIIKTYKHGYSYYKISGEKTLFSRLKDAKANIDSREKED